MWFIYRSRKWATNSGRGDLNGFTTERLNKTYSLCAAHFEDSQFMNIKEKRRLIWNAVPTLFDVPNPLQTIESQRPSPTHVDQAESKGKIITALIIYLLYHIFFKTQRSLPVGLFTVSGQKVPGHKVSGQKVPNLGNIWHKVPDHGDFLSGDFMSGDFLIWIPFSHILIP